LLRPDLKSRARDLVEKFLAADTVAAKAAFVRDPARVAPLMDDWYGRNPDLLQPSGGEIDVSGAGFYSQDVEHPISNVRVNTPGQSERVLIVEHAPDGDRIEWESSVGYNADLAGLFSGAAESPARVLRVIACFDDYFNFGYSDPGSHFCVRLHDPATREWLGYGYVPLDRADASTIASRLDGASPDDLRPLTVELRRSEATSETRQVEIVRMVDPDWRTDAPVVGFAGIRQG
jgi:hypothetical protein